MGSFERQTMINNLIDIRTSDRFSSVWFCFSFCLSISVSFPPLSHFVSLCLFILLSPLSIPFSFYLSLLWRHILSAWLFSSDFFSLGGVCQGLAGVHGYVWEGVKTSKTLSFNDFDTSQVCWLCLCLPEDFCVWVLQVFESEVCLLVHLIIKCGFPSNSLHTPSSPAHTSTGLSNIWNGVRNQRTLAGPT